MARTKKADQEAAPQETKSIEETFRELEAIVEQMESGDSTLEESFASYEAGMKLVKYLSGQIDNVEKQIQILSEGDENE